MAIHKLQTKDDFDACVVEISEALDKAETITTVDERGVTIGAYAKQAKIALKDLLDFLSFLQDDAVAWQKRSNVWRDKFEESAGKPKKGEPRGFRCKDPEVCERLRAKLDEANKQLAALQKPKPKVEVVEVVK